MMMATVETVFTPITLTRPDDWHVHLRDGQALATTVPHTAAQFARAICMPNLQPPVITASQALAYRQRIMEALPRGMSFQPLMVLYLTDDTSAQDIVDARQAGVVACKLYPAGATTNSHAGVTHLSRITACLEAMQQEGMLLLMHGEVTDPQVDIFDREVRFIDQHLQGLRRDFAGLRMVLEHITTQDAVQYVQSVETGLAATITAHHLLYNRNALFHGGMRPHWYCLPVLKREEHRRALLRAATAGDPRFFLGTDSAPHASTLKEHAQGCAGCYTAPTALEMYAQAFASVHALHTLEGFASHFGADFYGLPRNKEQITLEPQAWQVPAHYPYAQAQVKPLLAGQNLTWRVRRAAATEGLHG